MRSESACHSKKRNRYFQGLTGDYLSFLIPEGSRILSLGCGSGLQLKRFKPSYALGVDIDQSSLAIARKQCPEFEFVVGDIEDCGLLSDIQSRGPFDIVLLDDTLGFIDDIQRFLWNIRGLCNPETRLVSVYYSYLWEPLIWFCEKLGVKEETFPTTWLKIADVENLLNISGFESVKKEWRILCPFRFFGLGNLINRYIATLPIIRKICIRHFVVARPVGELSEVKTTVSVIIPCKNERGNVESAVTRLPKMGNSVQVVFVEGHSTDGTWEELQRVKTAYPLLDIKIIQQRGKGKGDAVRDGFDEATGEILVILDADLTVPPEDLSKFVYAISSRQAEFVNGSRLVYGREEKAMRYLNLMANHFFALIFTYLINQKLTDTLCGTKVLKRQDYERIAKGRSYFGDFDPFGDFDLIFGASKLNLKFLEIPIRYASRKYGETQISRFSHGLLLSKMVLFAFKKLKAF